MQIKKPVCVIKQDHIAQIKFVTSRTYVVPSL